MSVKPMSRITHLQSENKGQSIIGKLNGSTDKNYFNLKTFLYNLLHSYSFVLTWMFCVGSPLDYPTLTFSDCTAVFHLFLFLWRECWTYKTLRNMYVLFGLAVSV